MSYDPDVDEGQTQLYHQQIKNDERANINDRHRKTRGHLLQQTLENGNLIRANVDLEKKNQELAQKVEQLEGQLESVSSLAKTKLTNSAALLQTIRHLRNAWEIEQPNSLNRKNVDGELDQYYKNAIEENKQDRGLQVNIDTQIEEAKNNTPRRPARRMK